ncbi:MAG: molybdenum cofactor biosynthesis protein MoaB [Thermosynechococcaceae cyanobacterium MS004]|nr:molybdenum cofactor biosynthesis protein MoaB [Thermosynechococcaceae cyanobacterium MS004]
MAHTPHPALEPVSVGCAVVTISDTRSPAEDKSGQWIQAALKDAGHQVMSYGVVRDEPDLIRSHLQGLTENAEVQAIILNGGTGIAPRDTTYDAVQALLDKELPGFGELFRALSYTEIGSRAIATRATAGVYCSRLVFSLPGSTAAVRLGMESLILPELVHLSQLLIQ